ncbi:MAG: TPM domain-containing protein [Bacteroidales bacterium]|nr:TPM domain-containing protein [Candidatus Minthousia equi]
MKKRIVLTFAFLWSMIAGILAQEYTADNLPMPYLQDLRMHTCNPDNILSASTVASIDSLFFNLEREKGVQAIAIVAKRVEGGDPYSFGMSVAKKYGIGNKNNTGLLVILATRPCISNINR